jgi:uncharacterized protein DUF5994
VTYSPPKSLGKTRLAVCDRTVTQGDVDGAWWPGSSDLRSELPDLTAVFTSWIGPIRRVVYDPRGWLPAPPRIVRGGESISVDPYRLVAYDTIYLMGTHHRDALLYVVPPLTVNDAAHRVLQTVEGAGGPVTIAMLRRIAGSRTAAYPPPAQPGVVAAPEALS